MTLGSVNLWAMICKIAPEGQSSQHFERLPCGKTLWPELGRHGLRVREGCLLSAARGSGSEAHREREREREIDR